MDLQHIALSDLKVAAVNVRHGRKAPDVDDILPSIRTRGVLQPLLVRPSDHGFEIIAGRRRFFAASQVAQERGAAPGDVMVPCAVVATTDDVEALEASLIENVARAAMDELAEYEAFARLLRQGRPVHEIARTFGVTEQRVKQRLAIAGLHPKIKQAYRAGDIEADDLRLLTSASKGQQKSWVDLFGGESEDEDEVGGGAPRGYALRRWLFGRDEISTAVALFPVADYPGEIVSDLFGEVGYFADPDTFWEQQNAAVARLRDDLLAKGWQRVTVLERGTRFASWGYEEVAQEDGGHVYVEVRSNGEVEVHAGYRDRDEPTGADAQAGPEAEDVPASPRPDAPRPELTKIAENYVTLHRHAIVRAELLGHRAVALRLVVAHLVLGSPLWSVRAEPQRAEKEAIALSMKQAPAQAAFATERAAVLDLLDLDGGVYRGVGRGNGDASLAGRLLTRLIALSDEEVMRVLALLMAETLAAGSAFVEAAGAVMRPDVARWWTADETFLDLVRDRTTLNAMVREVAGEEAANANVAEPGKVQRGIIRDCLRGEGREPVNGWVPRSMAFPPATYDAAKTSVATEIWSEFKELPEGV